MKVLVFADKWIGLNCVKYLLEEFANDEYRFILGDNDSQAIAAELNKHGISWTAATPDAIKNLRQMPEGHFDWILNLWGSHIFKRDILSRTKMSLNIHPSYLPYCRGRDPVVWALRHGWPVGTTLHVIAPGVDEGDIFCQEEIQVEFPFRGEDVYQKVANKSWQIFTQNWPRIRTSEIKPIPQQALEGHRTFKRKDLVVDQVIDLDQDPKALEIVRRLLAHDFGTSYGSHIKLGNKHYRATLKLEPISKESI